MAKAVKQNDLFLLVIILMVLVWIFTQPQVVNAIKVLLGG